MGKIIELHRSPDGRARSADIQNQTYTRPVACLITLPDLPPWLGQHLEKFLLFTAAQLLWGQLLWFSSVLLRNNDPYRPYITYLIGISDSRWVHPVEPDYPASSWQTELHVSSFLPTSCITDNVSFPFDIILSQYVCDYMFDKVLLPLWIVWFAILVINLPCTSNFNQQLRATNTSFLL